MGRVLNTLKHGWNVFKDAPQDAGFSAGPSYPYPQRRSSFGRYFNDRTIIGSIYNRLAVDASMVDIYHAKLDENGIPIEMVDDGLNECLTLEANIDQSAFALKMDLFLTMFEEGYVAVVPTDADLDPSKSSSYDIQDMRVCRIVQWFPRKVTLEIYDDREVDDEGEPVNGGVYKQSTMEKKNVAIVENPFYSVMNQPNSTLQRLKEKLAQIDQLNDNLLSGKLDLIFQLPYAVRGKSRKQQAEERRKALSDQLKNDDLGIGYIDVSEKVIQLNRPVVSSLLDEIKDLKAQLYDELGLTPEIMNGTASPDALNAYFDRTIEPFVNAVALEFKRKFLTKTARTRRHSIEYFRDPLKLIPLTELAEVADKLTRNAIVTSNEFRPKIGYRPSKDPRANELRNNNMPDSDQPVGKHRAEPPEEVDDGQGLSGSGQARSRTG